MTQLTGSRCTVLQLICDRSHNQTVLTASIVPASNQRGLKGVIGERADVSR